jgi:hypothetical protein
MVLNLRNLEEDVMAFEGIEGRYESSMPIPEINLEFPGEETVRDLVDHADMVGGVIVNDTETTIGRALSMGEVGEAAKAEGTFVGPHITRDGYDGELRVNPRGIGVWMTKEEE